MLYNEVNNAILLTFQVEPDGAQKMSRSNLRVVIRFALIYLIFGGVWIIGTDRLVAALVHDPVVNLWMQTYKGWFFVLISAFLIGFLPYRELMGRRKAENSLAESEQRFRLLYENAPVGYQSIDASGKIVEVNRTWCEMLGYSCEEALGLHFVDFVAATGVEDFEKTFKSIVQNGEMQTKLELVCKDGEHIHTEFTARARLDSLGHFSHAECVFIDVTAGWKMELENEEQQEDYRTIFNTVPGIILYIDLENRLVRANQAARQIPGLATQEMLGKTTAEIIQADFTWFDAKNQKVIQSGMPEMRSLERYTLPGGHILWALTDRLPYRDENGKISGVIVFANDITSLKKREDELESLVHLAAQLRQTNTKRAIFDKLIDLTNESITAEGVVIAMAEPDGSCVLAWAKGRWAKYVGVHFAPGVGLSGKVIQTGLPVLSNDREEVTRVFHRDECENLYGAVCVPLIADNRVIGAIWVGFSSMATEADLRVMTGIADIAASAIHRAELNEQKERRLHELEALHTIDVAITSSLDLQVTLSLFLRQVIDLLGVDAADVLLLDSDTQQLTYAAGRGFLTDVRLGTKIRIGEGQAGRVALERRVQVISDLNNFPGTANPTNRVSKEKFRSYVGVPLTAKGQSKGVLELFSRQELKPSGEWLEFLDTLATQAAIAIDNSTLFEQIQRSNTELTYSYDATIEGWSRALELRNWNVGHSERVTELTLRLAHAMNVPAAEIPNYQRGALLHDVGEIAIPDGVLFKTEPLTAEDLAQIRRHPATAYELLSPIPYLRTALDIPYCHHERWNGSGYPRGLAGEQIPLSARLFAVIDVWDAMSSERPYRPAWPKPRVVAYLQEQAGVLFDPRVVAAFIPLLEADG
jgi:PAS domain S-box-containing protein